MAVLELAVILVLAACVVALAAYTFYLRSKLIKAVYIKSQRNPLARDPKEFLDQPWEPSLAARAAWKLSFSLVSKSLKQQKYKRLQQMKNNDDKERFIAGLVHSMIDRAVDSCATHGGRLRHAGALAKALAKRRGLRQLKSLAEGRRLLRQKRRTGQLAGNPHHQATSCGTLRSVNLEFAGKTASSFPLRPGAPDRTGPLALPDAPAGAGPPPGKREADRVLSLNASAPVAVEGDRSASALRATATAPVQVPGQLPDAEGSEGDDEELPLAFRTAGRTIRSRGALWLAEQGAGAGAASALGNLVIAFGDYQRGQLGYDPATAARQVSKNTIVPVEQLRGAEALQVEAAGVASFVVGSRGQLWGFGSNRSLELGARKEIAQVQAPQRVKSVRDQRAVQVASAKSASGQAHTLVLTDTGLVYTFGTSSAGALAQGPDVRQSAPMLLRMTVNVPIRQVIAGARHSLLVSDEGKIFSVGDNSHGQLGFGKRDPANAWSPKFVCTPEPVEGELGNARALLVAVGDDHNLATTEDGFVYAWGANSNGQLGIGRVGDQAVPVPVRDFQDMRVTSLACGSRHSLVVSGGGNQVWSFGSNVQGQLGHGESSASEGFQLCKPEPIALLSASVVNQATNARQIVQVAAAGCHSLAVTRTGELMAWGDNAYGQLGFPREGRGHGLSQSVAGAMQVAKYTQERSPQTKQSRSRASLEADAPKLFAEGVARVHVPVKVVSLSLYRVLSVSTSDMHSLVLAA